MKRMLVVGAILLSLGTIAFAQSDVVAHVKSDLVSRGVNLSGTCGAFEVTKRVAWTLRAQGWGLIAKASGDQCQGFAGDKLVSTTGRFVDILIDQGGANSPSWQERAASPEEVAARVEPSDPGDGAVPVPPVVVPPPPVIPSLSVDYDKIAALVKSDGDVTRAQLKAHDESPSYFVKIFGNRYVQMVLAAAGAYFAEWQAARK